MELLLKHNRKILFLFLVAVAIRFVNIGMPILEGTATRQTQTAMIARNLYEKGFDVMNPEVDHLGPGEQYLILEFPLLNSLAALGYEAAGGVREWIGRFWSIVFFSGGFVFLYLLVAGLFGKETAFWSSVVYSFSPLSIIYSRAFMPDFEMLFFSLGSMYLMYRYSESEDKPQYLYFSSVMFTLALLSKVQSFYVAVPLFYLLYVKEGGKTFTRPRNWAALLIGIVLPALWYFRAAAVQSASAPAEAYNFNIFHWIRPGEFVSFEFYKDIFRIYSGIFLTPLGFALFIAGFFVKAELKERFLYAWITGTAVFFVVFASHMDDPYYNLGVLPVASVLIARGYLFMREKLLPGKGRYRKAVLWAASLVTFLFIARYGFYYAYIVPRGYRYIPEGAKVMKQLTSPEDLVIASSAGGPAALYYCDRKGRPFLIPSPDESGTKKSIEIFEDYIREGCKYYFCPVMLELDRNPAFKEYLHDNYQEIASKKNKYIIYKLQP
ncbi:MAG: phospholipid carrier-dependent glycosyltransferase [Candidatus Omnitrophica bacterium]|nr:phospholipid carrier-dependent glycosyltransferase [Candidatus Omnitrophota bacterium]